MSVWSNCDNLPTGTVVFDDGAILRPDGVTYGTLIKVLKSLGFQERRTDEALLLRNKEHDALMALPSVSPDEAVWAAHLIEARTQIVAKGIIATPQTFDSLLLPQHTASRVVPEAA